MFRMRSESSTMLKNLVNAIKIVHGFVIFECSDSGITVSTSN